MNIKKSDQTKKDKNNCEKKSNTKNSKHVSLDEIEKTHVVNYKKNNPKLKHDEIVLWCQSKFNKTIDRSTVSKILKNKENIGIDGIVQKGIIRRRKVKFPELDEKLRNWFFSMQECVIICDDLIKAEAIKIAAELKITDRELKFSDGWLSSFKKRHGIKLKILNGEEGSIDPEIINTNLPLLQEKIKSYDPNNVYNFEETSLFFAMEPNKTLASKSFKGRKKDKDRISLGLCSNSTGSDKMKPLIIGRYERPRCFKGININNLGVEYFFNLKAWMTGNIFLRWISEFDKSLREGKKNRKILLLIDNAPCHKVDFSNLTNIEVLFLPSNTTSKIQPMDAGIIYSFKRKYKLRFIKWLYERYQENPNEKKEE